jgi:vacuolar-type H+-ATPase catalytic subunit A/Vma1
VRLATSCTPSAEYTSVDSSNTTAETLAEVVEAGTGTPVEYTSVDSSHTMAEALAETSVEVEEAPAQVEL